MLSLFQPVIIPKGIGAIYLLHAKSATNTQILGEWIDAVRAAGYEFGGGLPTTW